MKLFPLTDQFAAEVGDVDLSQPLDESARAAIADAFWKYRVLVFPNQQLTPQQHVAFGRCFGELERRSVDKTAVVHREAPRIAEEEIADVSNLTSNGIWGAESHRRRHEMGNQLWHTDSSFRETPAMASLLYAKSVPPVGGHTEFADEQAAYDALPEDVQRQIQHWHAEHSLRYSRARIGFTDYSEAELTKMAGVWHPLVRTIPQTGRKTLYLAAHAGRIRELPDEEGLAWIEELIAHATQRQFVYLHRYRPGDLVMWDNRSTMHRGTPFDDTRWPRDVQRVTVRDVPSG